jgi:AcrR family transcriptional regulator
VAGRRYEQRVRADSAEETRRRILDAVEERLRAAPAEPLRVDQVARAARVARSTVYLVFGSRAGLFRAFAERLAQRGGYEDLVRAKLHPDAREHLREGIRRGVALFAADRDLRRVLFSMARLDADAVGGVVQWIEEERGHGMTRVARRLAEQGALREDVTAEEAADLLWLLTSFDSFDQLYTGRGMSADEVAAVLIATAERSLLQT